MRIAEFFDVRDRNILIKTPSDVKAGVYMSIFKNISISPIALEIGHVGFFDSNRKIVTKINTITKGQHFNFRSEKPYIPSFKVNGRN